MKTLEITEDVKLALSNLQSFNYESNGVIHFKSDVSSGISSQNGQVMDRCGLNGCVVNYHTHPSDFTSLYPEHPSATDFTYIYNATGNFMELDAHCIVTPSFFYIVYFNSCGKLCPGNPFFGYKIANAFKESASRHENRGTLDFRNDWLSSMEKIGFTIHVFNRKDKIIFEVPTASGYIWYLIQVTIVLFVIVHFFRRFYSVP